MGYLIYRVINKKEILEGEDLSHEYKNLFNAKMVANSISYSDGYTDKKIEKVIVKDSTNGSIVYSSINNNYKK